MDERRSRGGARIGVWSWCSALVVVLCAAGCDGGGPESGPGVLTARVAPGNVGDAAVLIEFSELVRVDAGGATVLKTTARTQRRFLIVLPEAGEVVLRVEVPDTTSPPLGTVLQVADSENRSRSDLSGYTVEWVR